MRNLILSIILLCLGQLSFCQDQPGLHIDEDYTVLFGKDTTSNGLKTMWLPSKGAFRSGEMTSAWSFPLIGSHSAAFGYDTQAFGNYSFASGLGNIANSIGEFSIGRYSIDGGSSSIWINSGAQPVFEIGNGISNWDRSNLFTVQKSGNVKIGNMIDTSEVIREKLVVDGGIVIGSNVDLSPVAGTIRWSGTDFEGWDGSDWVSLTMSNNESSEELNKIANTFDPLNSPYETVINVKGILNENDDFTIIYKVEENNALKAIHFKGGVKTEESLNISDVNYQYWDFDMNNLGDIIVAYQKSDNRNYKTEFLNGSWSNEEVISPAPSPAGLAYSPKAVINNNQHIAIAWLQYDETIRRIFMSEFDGTTWTHPNDYLDPFIEIGSKSVQKFDIDIAETNNILLAWAQGTSTNFPDEKFYRSEKVNGTWIHPSDISDHFDNHPDADIENSFFSLSVEVKISDIDKALIVYSYIFSEDNYNDLTRNYYSIKDNSWTDHQFISGDELLSSEPQFAIYNIKSDISSTGEYVIQFSETREDGALTIFTDEINKNGAITERVNVSEPSGTAVSSIYFKSRSIKINDSSNVFEAGVSSIHDVNSQIFALDNIVPFDTKNYLSSFSVFSIPISFLNNNGSKAVLFRSGDNIFISKNF